jgi:hypothetical protein
MKRMNFMQKKPKISQLYLWLLNFKNNVKLSNNVLTLEHFQGMKSIILPCVTLHEHF